MRALLVDDERLARAELRRLLAAHPDVDVAGEAATVDEAARAVAALGPDLILLDVQLAGETGFDLLDRLDAVPTVVFVTAFDRYALRAFEVAALDYLLKPVDPARLADALARARLRAVPAPPPDAPLGPDDRVFVRDGDLCLFVRLGDVPLIEAVGNYVRLHAGAARPLLLRTLAALEARLDARHFARVNRSQIVGLAHIERVAPWPGGGLVLTLRGGARVEVSRRQAQRLREAHGL